MATKKTAKKKAASAFNIPKYIDVTAEDIKKGVPGSCCECAVALALRRAFGKNSYAEVSDSYPVVEIYNQPISLLGRTAKTNVQVNLELENAVGKFIEDFDEDRDLVKPRKFRVLHNSFEVTDTCALEF